MIMFTSALSAFVRAGMPGLHAQVAAEESG